MEEKTRALHVDNIRSDLNRIIDEWLHLHLRMTTILVLIALVVEILLGVFIAGSSILTTSIERYILKFILFPSGLSLLILVAAGSAVRGKRLTQRAKVYVMSLSFMLICFIYFTVHNAFVAIYALYAFAIFLTTTYADYKLTGIVSALSLLTMIVSELFFRWDIDKVSIFTDSTRMVEFLVAVTIIIGCSIVSNATIQYEQRKNEYSLRREVERELLKESMLYDELTGVYNRKALHEELRNLEQSPPTGSLIFGIADIDHFKSVNDLYGHHVGDLCLIEFACVLCEYFGESSVYRYGGDEFCLILKNTPLGAAKQLCERTQLRMRRVEFKGVPELKPTVCFGLAVYTDPESLSRLFNQADEALYEAKHVRNAISVYHDAPVTPSGRFRISSQEEINE